MTLNELVGKLQTQVSAGRGDLQVTTWEGVVRDIGFDIACDGIITADQEDSNEISIELSYWEV